MIELLICRSCIASQNGASPEVWLSDLGDASANAGLAQAMVIRPTECLGACKLPIAVALQGDGRASYVFSGLTGNDWIPDAIATCLAYLQAKDGWIEDATACGSLRYRLHCRIPALNRP